VGYGDKREGRTKRRGRAMTPEAALQAAKAELDRLTDEAWEAFKEWSAADERRAAAAQRVADAYDTLSVG